MSAARRLSARLRARLAAAADDAVLRRLAGGGAVGLAIKVAGAGLALAMLAGLSRAMEPKEFGGFAFGYSLAMVLSMATSLGLHNGILRWRPEHEVDEAPGLALAAERWGFNMTLATSASAAGLAVLLGWTVGPATLSRLGGLDLSGWAATAALSAALAGSLFLSSAARARGYVAAALLPREVIWRALVAGAAAAVSLGLVPSFGASEALWLSVGLLAAMALLQGIALRIRPGPQGRDAQGAPVLGLGGPARLWMRHAVPMWGIATLYAVSRHLEVVVVGAFVPAEATALYFAALSTAHVVSIIVVGLNVVIGPMIARAHYAGDRDELQRMMRLMMLGVSGPILISAVVLAVSSPFVLSVFDPAFAEHWPILVVLLAGTAFNSLAGPTSILLQLGGQERAFVRLLASVTLGVAGLQLVLTPIFGIWAAALLNAGGQIALNVAARQVSLSRMGVDPTLLSLLRWRRP